MDPNAAVREIRKLIDEYTDLLEDDPSWDLKVNRLLFLLIQAWEDLDDWLFNGGILPSTWDQARPQGRA
ncbi:hypothetical protein VMT65_07580 [Nocardia sp. CDC153]|uniref:hypothetical protein n=1 Tax=Nocardia sp. CDC153 TaxID=3112167 RepID=UPI002DB6A328|nr:hypothetical protein [Nocardia sp. CDC153]MEC3952886.1 hypothetical protein [Nocardia sp. CDC153]